MYNRTARLLAVARMKQGQTLLAISGSTGISRSTLRDWRDHPEKLDLPRAFCSRCSDPPCLPAPRSSYAYLLGLYLGDGCISRAGSSRRDVWVLRIMCADAWPGLQDECRQAMRAVHPGNAVSIRQRDGCVEIRSCSK